MAEIEGRLVGLSDGRMVFLAEHPKEPGMFYVGFKNKDGDDTKLKLSADALDALVAMRTDPIVGTPERTFPHKPAPKEWRVVDKPA